jgi:acetyl esterase/lipase
MFPLRSLLLTLLLAASALAVEETKPTSRPGRFSYPPNFEGATAETYKTVNGAALKVWIFQPVETKSQPGAKYPAIVFFFGGGWTNGSPSQFERHCRYLASRGMVAMTADYRVASRQQVKAAACVADAKSCIRWVRENAARLGIDPDRVAAGGGSAGGHLAAATATLPGLDDPADNKGVSCVPNALVLFNPALVLAPYEALNNEKLTDAAFAERLGCKPEEISPIHHVHAGLPPTLIMHGRADTTVPFATVQAFTDAMTKAGNRCELVGYEGERHGFFNASKYNETVAEMDRFLTSLGYLPPTSRPPLAISR